MAGANGPTSAGGTTETPNPEGGAVEKPAGGKAAEGAGAPAGKPGGKGSPSLEGDAQG